MQGANPARLTLVIPTFQRPQFIKRQIEYWADSPHHLLIVDGSIERWTPPRDLEKAKITYIHAPGLSPENRIRMSGDHIRTDYVALIPDDELFVKSAVEKCIAVLDSDAFVASCKGLAIGFHLAGGKVYVRPVYAGLLEYGVSGLSGENRMLVHLENYEMASLWAVQTRRAYVAGAKALSLSHYPSGATAEIAIALATAFSGKIVVLKELMWLRSYENENIWWGKNRLEFQEWFNSLPRSERSDFVHSIAQGIIVTHDIRPSHESIVSAIQAYCKAQLAISKSTRSKAFTVQSNLRRLVKRTRKLRNSLLQLLWPIEAKSEVAKKFGKGEWGSLRHHLELLSLQGIAFNRAEMSEIEQFLTEWALNQHGSNAGSP